jgi:hypothetical protein
MSLDTVNVKLVGHGYRGRLTGEEYRAPGEVLELPFEIADELVGLGRAEYTIEDVTPSKAEAAHAAKQAELEERRQKVAKEREEALEAQRKKKAKKEKA